MLDLSTSIKLRYALKALGVEELDLQEELIHFIDERIDPDYTFVEPTLVGQPVNDNISTTAKWRNVKRVCTIAVLEAGYSFSEAMEKGPFLRDLLRERVSEEAQNPGSSVTRIVSSSGHGGTIIPKNDGQAIAEALAAAGVTPEVRKAVFTILRTQGIDA